MWRRFRYIDDRIYMKLVYAKLLLKKFIKYNHDNLDENKLNRAIINLSHRVYKSHGQKGHNVRQSIRAQLVEYSKAELARYDVTFKKPLKVSYKNRFRYPSHGIVKLIWKFIWSLIRIMGIVILVLIIIYILHTLM